MNKFKKLESIYPIFTIVFAIIIILFFIFYYTVNMQFVATDTITVTDKTISGKSSTMKIYGRDTNDNIKVYEIFNNWFIGQVDSSDKYASIGVGKEYTLEVRGITFKPFDIYPNIVKIEEHNSENSGEKQSIDMKPNDTNS